MQQENLKEMPIKVANIKRKPTAEQLKTEDHKMVEGIFRFFEVPGGLMSFSFKKYKEDQIARYDFEDGRRYTIPLMVAKHLNSNCSYPVHAHRIEENGRSSQYINKMVRRCAFQSLEFMDVSDFGSDASSFIDMSGIV
jgi:hypothetical protein